MQDPMPPLSTSKARKAIEAESAMETLCSALSADSESGNGTDRELEEAESGDEERKMPRFCHDDCYRDGNAYSCYHDLPYSALAVELIR